MSPIANSVIGAITTDPPNGRSDGASNMPAGSLIADSQLAATQPVAFCGAVAAFINGGGVRSPGFAFAPSGTEGNGNVTYCEAFTVQPFGNSLVTMTLNTQNIRDFLEEQFAGSLGRSSTATRFALPSAGFKYTWDGAKECGAGVINVTVRTASGVETLVTAVWVRRNLCTQRSGAIKPGQARKATARAGHGPARLEKITASAGKY